MGVFGFQRIFNATHKTLIATCLQHINHGLTVFDNLHN
jgi:hypothetical protein